VLLTLAMRNIFRNRTRSFITLLAIASGSIAIILTGGFIEDTVTLTRESYIRDFIGHLRIYQPGFLDQGTLHPFDYTISQPGALLERLKSVEHISYVAPRLAVAGLLSNGDSTVSFLGEGVDPLIETSERSGVKVQVGASFDKKDGYQALLGKGLAKALSAKPGDSLVIVANTKRGAMNAADVTVQGIFTTANKAFDDGVARLPLAVVQKLLRIDDVQMLLIFLDKTENTDAVKKALQDIFQKAGLPYEVKAWYELEEADFILKVVAFYQRIFLVMKIIMLIVVTLSIVNTMNMAVLERIGEIGTMMALGTNRQRIVSLFLLEGLFLGMCGGFLGCAGGYTLALLISHVGISMPSPPGTTIQWIAHIAIVPGVFGFAFLMAAGTALLSAVAPAIKASRLDIAEGLRHNI
jgi:putative ABC transport system permease protein